MNEDKQDQADGVPIIPVAFRDLEATNTPVENTRPSAAKRFAIASLAVVLFCGVLVVIFVLPRYIQAPPSDAEDKAALAAPVAKTETETRETAAPTVVDPEVAAEHRQQSQRSLEDALTLVEKLKAHQVTTWAAEDFAQAERKIAAGEKAYGEQRYADALAAYSDALDNLGAIDARTTTVVSESIEDGQLALASENSTAASKAFQFALDIDADNELAKAGLARAGTLDQVLALVQEADGYEQLGELDSALKRYQEALELDAEAPGAASAVARIESQQREARYRRAMSQGFAASDAQQNDKARAAFLRAKEIKPNAQEVRDAILEVDNRILQAKISEHLSRAREAERREQWTTAATQFRAAAKLDNALAGAAQSAARATQRAKLDRQLVAMLERPDRIASDAVYREAVALLGKARAINAPGSRLSGQIKTLDRAIATQRTPLPVTLISDNATNVTIYRVGELGRFQQRTVSVVPGRYVAVGKRNGFRDVRVEFAVSSTNRNASVTVKCEEQLAFGN